MVGLEFLQKTRAKEDLLFLPFFFEDREKSLRKVFRGLSLAQKRSVKKALRSSSLPKGGILCVFSVDAPVLLKIFPKKTLSRSDAREEGLTMLSAVKQFQNTEITVLQGALNEILFTAFCEGVALGTYEFLEYKGKKFEEAKKEEKEVKKIRFFRQKDEKELQRLETMREAVFLTKDLVNHPPEIANPSYIEEKAREVAKKLKSVTIKVLKEKELEKLGCNGLLGVGRASDEESRLIILEYKGGGKENPIALVGKGVTYDTGGLSIKPSNYMAGMKQDLAGAATVLGAFFAIANSGVKKNVVAFLPTVENLVSRKAYKPDDVLKMHNGVTVEVTNTDAEGRLILADALSYAEKEYTPRAMVDLATLTGACAYAVGEDFTAGLSTDPKLFYALKKAAQETDELLWELPLHAKYEENLKSPIADIVNSSKMKAGTIEGGLFLKNFVTEKTPWCHLDIASVAFDDKTHSATGQNVRMLWKFVESF
jgi:leucyl aminopeptidase